MAAGLLRSRSSAPQRRLRGLFGAASGCYCRRQLPRHAARGAAGTGNADLDLPSLPYAMPAWACRRPERNASAVRLVLPTPRVPEAEESAEAAAAANVVVLEPGLVVIRRALAKTSQQALAAEAWAEGAGERRPEHRFFEDDGTLRGPKACEHWVARARAADPSMPKHEASHLLLLYYRLGGTLGFHRDEQANDGTGDEPVVNLSLGAEVDFAYRHCHSDVAKVVTLESGDVILFGGPCRRLLHAVLDTRPPSAEDLSDILPADAGCGRLSFTLRHAPEVLGFEHLYADFRPQSDDPKRRVTGDEVLLGESEAQKRLKDMTR
eukprot:TRINITY_DN33150_c0_g1_i2.p1 TRINITY_DN33150_c0_g1~~TRINITY_DN33150_c0_g1_i2.p1  ORF type:complete len:322 (+),score=68.34 TRINITY_DN33150_c0_g1_i2:117-1082(+)